MITSPVEILRRITPDGRAEVAAELCDLADDWQADLILATGGTGPSPRDLTPEAMADVIKMELPGFGEAMRAANGESGRHRDPVAASARGCAARR